ncbi:hypothetical protein WOLCODRAFT_153856 [Wolfiporia cocos MD-104 SS10]|uniref:Uncharacterized protein n=1 Tax=Wolfiporia cocos (strain MD-104) TaxID=742152 RepID=A0A2H3K113_WOLCO|nr:hypothetical protein WOLCODRAFT_153856 [Wolfiporia cocos MD-104 SS10]
MKVVDEVQDDIRVRAVAAASASCPRLRRRLGFAHTPPCSLQPISSATFSAATGVISRRVVNYMIRRNPTLIPMCDSDVQQVREAVAKRKAEARVAAEAARASAAAGRKAKDTTSAPSSSQPYVAAEDAKRKREAMTRDERLGLR